VEISKEKIRSFTVEKNPFLDSEKHRGVAVAKFLVEKKVEIVLARKIGEGSYSVLKGNLIKIYKIPENIKTSQEAINLLREGKLERI
jgi:predicted Fe-Mo cluster-binding NifX family protein